MPTADPYAGLTGDFSFQLHQLVSAVQAQGGTITFNSGKREMGQPGDGKKGLDTQYGLYERAVAKYGKDQAANWAAVPGTSNHEKGMAMDIGGDKRGMALAHQLAAQYGLAFPLSNEPWHVQPANLSSHDNKGGPGAATPVTTAESTVPIAEQNTAEARVGSVINFLTGGSSTTAETSILPGETTSNILPTMTEAAAPSIPKATSMGGMASSIGGASAYDAQFEAAAKKYGISAALLKAVAKQESGFNPNAKNASGASGLMQFMPGTAKSLGIDPMNPDQAIDGAARMLSGLIKQFGSTDKALAAYNAGPGNVQKYGGIPPFKETQNYVKNIMAMVGGN